MTHPCEHLFDPTSFIRTCRSADFWQAACLRSWDPARCPGTRNEQDTRWCPTQHSLPALQISHHLSMPSLLAGDLRSEQLRCFLQDKARDPEENVALKPHHMLWRRAWRWWKSHSPRNKWANLVCEFNPNIYMSYWIIIPNHQVNSNHHPKPPGDFFLHLKNHQTCSMVRISHRRIRPIQRHNSSWEGFLPRQHRAAARPQELLQPGRKHRLQPLLGPKATTRV